MEHKYNLIQQSHRLIYKFISQWETMKKLTKNLKRSNQRILLLRKESCSWMLLFPFRDILEYQLTNQKSNNDKAVAWEKIAATYNAGVSYKREVKSLRNQYGTIKSEAKRTYAAARVS